MKSVTPPAARASTERSANEIAPGWLGLTSGRIGLWMVLRGSDRARFLTVTEQIDLFELAAGPMLTSGQRKKLSTRSKKHGHAAPPGTGPEGETCGSCKHLSNKRMASTYHKCDLMMAVWTGGAGTDVRLRDPACKKWESQTGG